MNIEKMTNKQLATAILRKKIANKINDKFIKEGLEELERRNAPDIPCKLGMIYFVSESQRKETNKERLNEFLKEFDKSIDDFQDTIKVASKYCVKPAKEFIK